MTSLSVDGLERMIVDCASRMKVKSRAIGFPFELRPGGSFSAGDRLRTPEFESTHSPRALNMVSSQRGRRVDSGSDAGAVAAGSGSVALVSGVDSVGLAGARRSVGETTK